MLLSNIIPGFSLAEAKDSINEYEQFKTAMEVGSLLLVLCNARELTGRLCFEPVPFLTRDRNQTLSFT